LTSWNVFSHHFFGFFEFWPLTSWNIFSHHFRIFLTWTSQPPETSFLIIFLDFLNFDLWPP
jgi:hypothetical protein